MFSHLIGCSLTYWIFLKIERNLDIANLPLNYDRLTSAEVFGCGIFHFRCHKSFFHFTLQTHCNKSPS